MGGHNKRNWSEIFGKIKRDDGESRKSWFLKISRATGMTLASLEAGWSRWGAENGLTNTTKTIPDALIDYREKRNKDGSVEINDTVSKKLTDEQIFERYGRSQEEWRISMVWFKDRAAGGYVLSCCFVPRKNEKYINVIEELRNEAKKYSPKYKKIAYKKNHKNPVMLEICIYDLHYGKLCWGMESGQNYDSKIAEQRFNAALTDLVSRASLVYNVEKIVFVFGNDFFNSDGIGNATTAGTPQDTDVRWQKMFTEGRKLIVSGIEKLMSVAPVEAIGIYGNHANQAEFYLGDAIECWFHTCPNVEVNNSPRARKYILYGNSLLGFTHGNLEKEKDLPLLMASEASDLWGKAIFREWHRGDKHHERELVFNTTVENKTVVVRTLSSLSGTDAWHNKAGYIGSKQSATAFVWGKNNGLENIYYHNIK